MGWSRVIKGRDRVGYEFAGVPFGVTLKIKLKVIKVWIHRKKLPILVNSIN